MMDRLLREGNPPAGQLASPKPQYKDVHTNNWEELKGEGGASYVKDKDVFAKLEAVLAKLADLESELATIKANLSGTIVELGLLADRPTATPENKGMGYFAWDAPEGNKLTYSDGTKWVVI